MEKQSRICTSYFSLLVVLVFPIFTSCHGQVNKKTTTSPLDSLKTSFKHSPKLVKSSLSNQAENVHCGLQDKNGNLWFGTTGDGVYCFNGESFVNYTVKDGLSSNTVYSIFEDKKGIIWFGTDDGISNFDGLVIHPISIHSNTHFQTNSSLNTNSITKNGVSSIFQDKIGIIWFGTDEGLYCFDGKSFTQFLDNPRIINKNRLTLKSVQCILEDGNGNLWFGSGPFAFEGILKLHNDTLINYTPQNEKWIRNISETKNGTLLFSTRHVGVLTYDGVTFSELYKPQKLKNDLLNASLVDGKGNIWYTSDYTQPTDFSNGGVFKFDGNTFIEYPKQNGLTNTSVMFLMEDKKGNIWFGTRNTGLFQYDGSVFTSFSD